MLQDTYTFWEMFSMVFHEAMLVLAVLLGLGAAAAIYATPFVIGAIVVWRWRGRREPAPPGARRQAPGQARYIKVASAVVSTPTGSGPAKPSPYWLRRLCPACNGEGCSACSETGHITLEG
jgi:hypothetical protein